MKRLLAIFVLLLPLTCLQLAAQEIKGTWKGNLDLKSSKLTVVFHFNGDTCTMDSPNQGAKGIPVEVVYMSSDSVSVSNKQIGMAYSGKLRDGKINGQFKQRAISLPLILTPSELPLIITPSEVVRNRPQTPKPPYPYRTEDVSFTNGDVSLSGTLTYPENWNGKKKVPVAIMVSGSGLQTRDEEAFGHKVFLVIADYLARHGVATLRYDDRGAGLSTGDGRKATTKDFMEDASAGIEFLRSKGGFRKVGIIGHSEGGEIAFMLGAREKVDFLVSLAGPGVQGDSILVRQNNNALRKAGHDITVTREEVREAVKSRNNPWIEYFSEYDPVQDIQKISCPALILNGDKDTQVESAVNIPSIEGNLPRDRRGRFASRHTEIKVYPGLNHLFQHCTTGQSEEYIDIEETFSPEVLEDIAAWIGKL